VEPNYRLWANKQYHNLTLPLPWRPFDRLKVLSNAEGERKPAVVDKPRTAGEERGKYYHPPLCPLPSREGCNLMFQFSMLQFLMF
jgi:hypothetical protein